MEENKNVKSVHLGKARAIMILAFLTLLGSVSSYIYPLAQGVFDFGFLFGIKFKVHNKKVYDEP